MAMSFTFRDEEFDLVLKEWARLRDSLDSQKPVFEQLGVWSGLPPAQDSATAGFMAKVNAAVGPASQSGAAALAYVEEFHQKLVSAKREYLDVDEDGVRRFRITLVEGDQS